MRDNGWRTVLAASVSTMCLLGCGEKSPIHKQVRDPLLISKKPVETQNVRPVQDHVAHADLSPPPIPEAALATAPGKLETIGVNRVEHADAAPMPAKATVNATPAVRTENSAAPAATVSRREPASIYGHAPDHS